MPAIGHCKQTERELRHVRLLPPGGAIYINWNFYLFSMKTQ